jgi:hypothetical protein
MNKIISFLQQKKIDEDFRSLGFDVAELFASQNRGKDDNPYEEYEWLVKKGIPRFGTIINAVPPDAMIDQLPWEEWFVLEGKQIHHVLYLKEPHQYDEIFDAPQQDDIHPPRTLGKKWFVIDDQDMSPVLLR